MENISQNSSFSVFADPKSFPQEENERRDNSKKSVMWKRLRSNPFILFSISLVGAILYGLIPVMDYWFYYLFKNQLWTILCIVEFMEIQELCLMDFPYPLYVISYVIGVLVPPVIHVFGSYLSPELEENLGGYANTIAIIIILLVYVADVISHPHNSQARESSTSVENSFSSSSETVDGIMTIYDTFSASLSDIEVLESSNSQSPSGHKASLLESDLRVGWAKQQRKLSRSEASVVAPMVLDKIDLFGTDNSGANNNNSNLDNNVNNSNLTCGICATIPCVGTTAAVLCCWTTLLPRNFFRRAGLSVGRVNSDRRIQLLLVFLYNTVFSAYFYFITYFIAYFGGDINSKERVLLFMVYVFVGLTFSKVAKKLGMMLDSRKYKSSSMFFIAELTCLLYYYTFYRVLFESIDGWGEFMFIECIHLLSEWCLYPMRSMELTYSCLQQTERRFLPRGSILSRGLNHWDWLNFISLEFGIRCTVMVSTGVAVLLISYLIDYVPWIHNSLQRSGAEMRLNSELLTVAVVLEIINALIMNKVYFAPLQISVISKVRHCFQDIRFAYIATLTAAILFINPIFVFTTNNKF